MKTQEVNKEDLDQLQQKAVEKAIRENKALGLAYKIVEEGELIEVASDGTRKKLGKSQFGTVKVKRKVFRLKK